jgi:tRNA(adenine34) deaminase
MYRRVRTGLKEWSAYAGTVTADLDALMLLALDDARAALVHDDVPVGAVVALLDTGEVLARRHNERELHGDPAAHAELLALRDAARVLGTWRLDGCVLVSTLEPCPMCAGAALAARIPMVAFGAADPKAGALGSLYNLGADPRLNHEIEVRDGLHAEAAAALLREFFASRRRLH